ncbi:MAG: hypothetical protein HQL50_16225, partial [Magnetococcales bacterium]|nr:hypothetical protein [Magnetococcales bacterium]
GAWLHDCGKVTTPEYVVDKASKLETIYNRIHEVRMRFEVLIRDAWVDYYKALADHPDAKETLAETRDTTITALRDDFAFIAECNVGGEFMADEKIERLNAIAQRTWTRHLDNRIGLSQLETQRMERTSAPTLPVEEPLLSDRPDHIIERPVPAEHYFGDNALGFTSPVPEHLYNLGELYNLSIKRGTLSEEDRFKINEHVIETIRMLNLLPFPDHLKRVPEYAGNHHETMIGSGYPRGLTADQLTIPERIMGLADIFEALTAADRPYKTPKTLTQALKIMTFMIKDGHLDSDLFELFLKSGVFRDYADTYLRADQIDDVKIDAFIQ